MKRFLAFLSVILIIAMVLAGCNAKVSSINEASNHKVDNYGYASKDLSESVVTADKTSSDSTQQNEASALTGNKIIKSADIDVETKTYDNSVKDFEAMIIAYNGFIQDSNVEGGREGENRLATYTVRVPNQNLENFINKIGDIGVIVKKQIKGEDVTDKYFDTESRVNILKIERERVMNIMSKAANVSELLELEKRLSDINSEIDSLTGTLKKYDALIEYSTVTADIREVERIEPNKPKTFIDNIGYVFSQSLSAIYEGAKIFVLVLTAVLPFAVIIGVILIIIFAILRNRTKKIKKQDSEK